jgi:hypothetical protein
MTQETYTNFAYKATVDAHATTSMRQRLETLAIQREVWETTQLADSNGSLYQLLGDCKELYRDLTIGENSRVMKQGFNDYVRLKGYVFKSSSPLTLKVIHCVFGAKDRRRLSTYHTVLRVAIAENWKVEEVAEKIIERGGIQEISLQRKDGLKPKEKAEISRYVLMSQCIATLSSDALKAKMNIDHIHESAVAVLTLNGDGSYSVHCVVKSNAAVDVALAAYFSQNKVEIESIQRQRFLEKEEAAKAALISDAVNSANDSMINQAA